MVCYFAKIRQKRGVKVKGRITNRYGYVSIGVFFHSASTTMAICLAVIC